MCTYDVHIYNYMYIIVYIYTYILLGGWRLLEVNSTEVHDSGMQFAACFRACFVQTANMQNIDIACVWLHFVT